MILNDSASQDSQIVIKLAICKPFQAFFRIKILMHTYLSLNVKSSSVFIAKCQLTIDARLIILFLEMPLCQCILKNSITQQTSLK